eukprot:gene33519-40554_t
MVRMGDGGPQVWYTIVEEMEAKLKDVDRCGYTCCVLQPAAHAAVSVHPDGAPCAAPLQSSVVCKVERYQSLLNAVCPPSPTSPSFAPLGSASDGYTSAIVKTHSRKHTGLGHLHTPARVFAVRAGEQSFMYELASTFHLDKSALAQAFLHIQTAAVGITSFLSKRIVGAADWEQGAVGKTQDFQAFHGLVGSTVQQTMEKEGVDHPDVLDALAHISTCIGADPPLQSSTPPSALALSLTLSSLETGRFAVKGGAREVENAFAQTIVRAGGLVVEKVEIGGLELEEVTGEGVAGNANQNTAGKYKAVGISVFTDHSEVVVSAEKGVVSGLGVLCTHLALLPAQALSSQTVQALSTLTEATPVVKCVFWLGAAPEPLGVKGLEYFEVGASDGVGVDGNATNASSQSEGFVKIWSPSAMDPSWPHAATTVLVVELPVPDALLALKTHQSGAEDSGSGANVFMSTKDVETDVNHADFAKCIGRKLVISASKRDDLLRRAEGHMYRVYPRCRGSIVFSHLELPVLGGQRLANNTEKYTSNIGASTDVKNFFLTGVDISTSGLMGELQAGWITASAMLGYNLNDLNSNRNVVLDLLSM